MTSSGYRLVALATLAISVALLMPSPAAAQAAVTTDFVDGRLYYVNASGVTEMISVAPGVNPDSLIFALTQLIYYTLYGSGQVGVFNPYSRSNTILVSGLDHPTNLVLEPGCQSILVSVQGLTSGNPSLVRIAIPSGLVTVIPISFTPVGLAYDSSGRLFVGDSGGETVDQINPNNGAILNTLPSSLMSPNNQPDIPNGMTFDKLTEHLFITSSVYGGIYEIPTDLSSYQFLASVPAPANGIVSNGGGTLFAAGNDTFIYQYSTKHSTLSKLVAVPGLDGIAIVPSIGCSLGTSSCKAGGGIQ